MNFVSISSARRGVIEASLLGVVYFVLARLGIEFGSALGNVSPIWPAAGAAIGWLSVRSLAPWPGVFAGTLAAVAMTHAPPTFTLTVSFANTLEALGVAYFYRRGVLSRPRSAPERLMLFVGLSALSILGCALAGAAAAKVSGIAGEQRFWSSALFWFMGDLFGALVVAAPVVILRELVTEGGLSRNLRRDRSWPVLLASIATAGASWLSAEAPAPLGQALRFLPLTIGAFAVIYGGWLTRTLVTLVITLTPTCFLLIHLSVDQNKPTQIALLQIYNSFSALFCLLLGALFDQVRAAERAASRLADDLTLSNKRLEEVAYVAAHDLRSPLRSIVNWTQKLEQLIPPPRGAQLDKALNFVQTNAKKSVDLINAVMDLAKVQVVPTRVERVDLNQAVRTVLQRFDDDIRQLDASVKLEGLPVVRGDPSYMELVFFNLIGNSLKFRRPGRRPLLRIGARDRGDFYEVFVEDNGVGVAPEDRERIFQIFVRGSLNEGAPPGAGIGLAFCRQIVQAHRGRIWVDSTPDEGSIFCFTHPKQAER